MNYIMQGWGGGYLGYTSWSPFIVLLLIWSLFWKGLGLWHSAKRKQGWWFIAMLVINTMGILELIYLFAIAKVKAAELFDKK